MKKKPTDARITVRGTDIAVIRRGDEDYISLTDIAKSRNPDHPDDLIRNWLRNRNTLELLGIWELNIDSADTTAIKKMAPVRKPATPEAATHSPRVAQSTRAKKSATKTAP